MQFILKLGLVVVSVRTGLIFFSFLIITGFGTLGKARPAKPTTKITYRYVLLFHGDFNHIGEP